MNRRDFLAAGASCAAHLSAWSALAPRALRERFTARQAGQAVATEPWGRLERLADGVWALISTPLASGPDVHRTFANGGIVAGRDGVVIVEGFASDAGAQWMAGMARTLTGRAPTHVVVTHYHGDHSAGLAGYLTPGPAPRFVTTESTRARLDPSRAPAQALAQAELVAPESPLVLDLGGRRVTVTPRAGHTASDLTVAVGDPPVVFGGDLLWNGLFPNYRDAVPSVLSRAVRELLRGDGVRVPGHGAIPTAAEAANYVAVLDLVEAAARRALAAGTPMAAAAAELTIPESLGAWGRFSDRYYLVALQAWERELRPG